MIDFNLGDEILNRFFGSEKKTTVLYDGSIYMIKYPDPVRERNNLLSYMNNQYSEYIGCRVFQSCGLTAQETALGHFTDAKGINKVVVGCKDFTENGGILHEFYKLSNQVLIDEKLDVSIENVMDVISRSNLIKNKDEIMDNFWDMFVVDALIGNPDRHLENWGILYYDGKTSFAPIYDCGSSLAALIDDEKMKSLMENETEFKSTEFNLTSCYHMNGKRIFYHEIFKSPPAPLMKAIARIVPKIMMETVFDIVDSTPTISQMRKAYLKKAMQMRYEQILLPAYHDLTTH